MRVTYIYIVLFLSVMGPLQAQTAKELEGCWRIQTIEINKGGTSTEPFGPAPAGQLMFTDRHMTNIAMRPDLPMDFQSGPGPTITTIIAYFASYKLDGRKVVAIVEGSSRADWRGKTVIRTISQLTSDELVFVDTPQADTIVRVTSKRC